MQYSLGKVHRGPCWDPDLTICNSRVHLNAGALVTKGYTIMPFILVQAGLDARILGPVVIPSSRNVSSHPRTSKSLLRSETFDKEKSACHPCTCASWFAVHCQIRPSGPTVALIIILANDLDFQI